MQILVLLWVLRLLHVREYGVRISGNFCCGIPISCKLLLGNPESLALESGIQLKESTIPLSIGIRNPSATVPGVESRSKTILDSLTWGDSGQTLA